MGYRNLEQSKSASGRCCCGAERTRLKHSFRNADKDTSCRSARSRRATPRYEERVAQLVASPSAAVNPTGIGKTTELAHDANALRHPLHPRLPRTATAQSCTSWKPSSTTMPRHDARPSFSPSGSACWSWSAIWPRDAARICLHTGEVPQQNRRLEIQRFKTDPRCRLLLSTDSGGVGLNLQAPAW